MTDTHLAATATAGLTLCLVLAACGAASVPVPVKGAGQPGSQTTASARAPATGTSTSPATADVGAAQHLAADAGDACLLITQTDVTSSVGTELGEGTPASSGGATQCSYGAYPTEVLLVNVLPVQGRASYDHARQNRRLMSISGARVVDLAGLGDEAFMLSMPHTDAVYFTKAETMVTVSCTSPRAPQPGAALALAKIAVGRL